MIYLGPHPRTPQPVAATPGAAARPGSGETGARLFDAGVIEVLAARYRAERLAQLGITLSEASA